MARQELLRLANSLYESSANPDTQRIPQEFAPDQRPLAAFGQNGFFEYGETTDVSETTTGGAYHTLMSNKEVLDLGGDPVTTATTQGWLWNGNGTPSDLNHANKTEVNSAGNIPSWDNARTFATALNNSDQVVGYEPGSDQLAFLWSKDDGLLDLNGLIDPNLGITLTRANGINDMGQIIAYSESGFVRTAYLLTPVPEPSSLVLLTPFFETVCVK